MKKSISWLKRNFNDFYIKEKIKNNLRSRSWFKLKELNQTDNFLRHGMSVVDFGSSPGGWSEYAVKKVGKKGKVFALDILPMKPIIGVNFFQGNFYDRKVSVSFLKKIKKKVDFVMSDMSPNKSGFSIIDNTNAINLAKNALSFANKILNKKGSFLVKLFQGSETNIFIRKMRSIFLKVRIRKPNSSRSRSSEIFVIAKRLKF